MQAASTHFHRKLRMYRYCNQRRNSLLVTPGSERVSDKTLVFSLPCLSKLLTFSLLFSNVSVILSVLSFDCTPASSQVPGSCPPPMSKYLKAPHDVHIHCKFISQK